MNGDLAGGCLLDEAVERRGDHHVAVEQHDDVDDFADDATAAYEMPDDESESEKYEFPSLMDATPSQMAGTDSNDDDDVVMRLDLGSLDVDAATRPSWSQAGDDPLISGSDELQ